MGAEIGCRRPQRPQSPKRRPSLNNDTSFFLFFFSLLRTNPYALLHHPLTRNALRISHGLLLVLMINALLLEVPSVLPIAFHIPLVIHTYHYYQCSVSLDKGYILISYTCRKPCARHAQIAYWRLIRPLSTILSLRSVWRQRICRVSMPIPVCWEQDMDRSPSAKVNQSKRWRHVDWV